MNIESILRKIDLFNELVIDSGFKRDIVDYRQSLNQSQNHNLIFMKDLSKKTLDYFVDFANNELDHELTIVLKNTLPFTKLATEEKVMELDKNKEIPASSYVQQFVPILDQLIANITENENELNNLQTILSKYISVDSSYKHEDQAFVSLIFKDLKSTGTLKEFSKALKKWDRTLYIYQTLLKSGAPEEISLEGIQNGSIDVVFNIDFNIAVDLTELVKTGFQVYAAYLLYKTKMAKEIIDSYLGNKVLINGEKARQEAMLANIKDSVANKVLEQHERQRAKDSNIEHTSIKKRIDEVSSVITEHIIKGNEVKLLTIIEDEVGKDPEEKLSIALRKEVALVRERSKAMKPEDQQLLLELYSIKEEEESKIV